MGKQPVIRWTYCYRIQVLLLLCLTPPVIAIAFGPGAEKEMPAYHLAQLAQNLGDAPAPVRADLAYAAVSELAAAFAQESTLARQEMYRHPGQRKLQRWAVAVESLAFELDELAQTVTAQSSVQIGVGVGNSLYLVVDDQPVVVSGPRTEDQADLENRIVSRFCSLHPCEQLITLPSPSRGEPLASIRTPETRWSFSAESGPICSTDDGLDFRFDNASDLRRKREACERVVDELHLLGAEIIERRKTGIRVDWDAMKIVTLPLGGAHEIHLNTDGDVLNLYVPALAAAPELFTLLRPWLAANVSGVEHRVIITDAERLLPPVGFLGQ